MAGTTGKASAALTVYTNRAAFLAATNAGYYQEGFESTTIGPTSFNFSGGGSGTPYKYVATTTAAAGGFYPFVPNGGPSGQALATSNSNQQIVFTVAAGSAPITAFGGYFFDTDAAGSLTATLPRVTTDQNAAGTYAAPTSSSFTSFIGYTSTTPFTSLTVYEAPTSNQFPSIDNLIVGTASPVPEPATLAVLGIPAASGLLRRRRRVTA